jgi:predicted RNA-binding protein
MSLFVLVATPPTKANAGPGWAGCFALCMTGCIAGSWLLASVGCTVACTATCTPFIASCFGSDTKIKVLKNGQEIIESIHAIHSGDWVQTLREGNPVWTKLIENKRTAGEFEFIQITAEQKTNGKIYQIQVTPEHGLVLINQDGDKTIDAAEHLQIGDKVLSAEGDVIDVIDVNRLILNEKYTLVTEDGTILGSGIFVTTLCNEEIVDGEKLFDATIKKWRDIHNFSGIH